MKAYNLFRYSQVCEKKEMPVYLKTKNTPVEYDSNDPIETLWRIHDETVKSNNVNVIKVDKSLLDLKIEIVQRLYSDCILCEHKCHINRNKDEGVCGVKKSMIASDFLHHGEEFIFTPSYTIFFSGCNFSCCFCQNADISQFNTGLYRSHDRLNKRINHMQMKKAMNVNWVGGEPTPNLLYILKTLKKAKTNLPQIWNSNMYCSKETMKILNGLIDLYLTDFKYGNNQCSRKLANIDDYLQIIKRNHLLAKQQTDVFIRHLVLPHHRECCSQPILDWLSEKMKEIPVHIMDQYYPCYKARYIPSLAKSCRQSEIKKIINYAKSKKIMTFQD